VDEHRRRYEAQEARFNFTAMCKALTSWRGYAASPASLNAQSRQVTAKRVALAFDAFFRRVEAGKTAGYPPCKSLNRFSGWGWLEVARQGYYQGNGWHFPVRYERYPDAG
jgi:putative transposase